MAKRPSKPHAAANVAAIDANIAADLTGGAGLVAPTIGSVALPSAPSGPPLVQFTQPLRPAAPPVAPVVAVQPISPPPSSGPDTATTTGAAPASIRPRPAMHQPLFGDDDEPAPVAIATPTDESPELIAARARIAEQDAKIAGFEAAVAAVPIQIGELEHVESPVADELRTRVIQPILERELAKQKAAFDERLAQVEGRLATQSLTEAQRAQNTKARAVASLNEAIFVAHPDFSEVSNSDWYLRSLTHTIPLTTRTFGEEIKAAYKANNAEQFNKLVSHMKSNYAGSPTPAMVFGSNGMPDLSPVPTTAAALVISREEMATARTQFQQGRLGRKEYQEKVRQYEAQT